METYGSRADFLILPKLADDYHPLIPKSLRRCQSHFVVTMLRFASQRYIVGIPIQPRPNYSAFFDRAQKRFAETCHPCVHCLVIATAWIGETFGMAVKKANYVAVLFFSLHNAFPIKSD